MNKKKMILRKIVILLLCFVTVVAPIALYTDKIDSSKLPSSSHQDSVDDAIVTSSETLTTTTTSSFIDEPSVGVVVLSENYDGLHLAKTREHASARVLFATDDGDNPIRHFTLGDQLDHHDHDDLTHDNDKVTLGDKLDHHDHDDLTHDNDKLTTLDGVSQHQDMEEGRQSHHTSDDAVNDEMVEPKKQNDQVAPADFRVRHLKDQLIRARVYLTLPATRNNPHLTRELRLRMKELQRALGAANKDSELPKNAYQKLKAMEQTLAKGKQIQDDCTSVVKKLRAMLHSSEDQLRVHKKQTTFLTQLTAKTLPKGLHCLPLRLTTEYYTLNYSQKQFPNQEKLKDPKLYHYALFSDNILAAAVVVNSTVTNAKNPSKHVFHIVTDRLNYAAMRMWFHMNPPGRATLQVQSVEEFTWLNSSYSPVLQQLGSQSMIDYYFRAHRANSDPNLKFRNPKYLSILNHLRFYLPEIFPTLNKVVFLDDDIVVQKDLAALWSLNLKGNVNGAVETCRESFHRFDRYLNFSNPLIAKNFDPRACGWAYGMNIFDLEEWKQQNITDVYHKWQRLNQNRQLWKLGTLPPGLITFWKCTYALDKSWHVLGLGYNPNVNQREIETAAVVHYNGNMKPWLEIGIPKYRHYWAKYVDYDNVYLRECNINP